MKKVFLMMSIILFACVSMTVTSCSNEEFMVKGNKTEDFIRTLKFQTLTERFQDLKQKYRKTRSIVDINEEEGEEMAEGINLIIFRFKIARKSLNCEKGFGVCDFIWFPKENLALDEEEEESFEEYASIMETDESGYQYMELRLGEPVDTSEMPEFIVDEDVVGFCLEELEEDLIIKQGHYIFDRNIGEFGGYRITVEKDSIK